MTVPVYPLVKEALFLLPPEAAHRLAFSSIRFLAHALPLPHWDPLLSQRLFGVDFPAPCGLAAGFDKDACGVKVWDRFGFGFAEIGTITPRPQPGNPRPRLFRLPNDRALINRMGFNNEGVQAAVDRVQNPSRGIPIAANIGKNKSTSAEQAVEDYVACARALSPLVDFLVVNVSSPNTPGLRDLQTISSLEPLLIAVIKASSVPVLVKIAPDLADADIEAVAELAVRRGLAGIVACNTTISRSGLQASPSRLSEIGPGGASGPLLAARAKEVLRVLRSATNGSLPLISVGGITSAQDAWDRIVSGASLVEGYTGFIYEGPLYAHRINKGVAKILRQHGFSSLSEAVGSGAS